MFAALRNVSAGRSSLGVERGAAEWIWREFPIRAKRVSPGDEWTCLFVTPARVAGSRSRNHRRADPRESMLDGGRDE